MEKVKRVYFIESVYLQGQQKLQLNENDKVDIARDGGLIVLCAGGAKVCVPLTNVRWFMMDETVKEAKR